MVFLTVLFLVFLLRHLAFAGAALSSAPRDMRSRTGFDWGYHPFVTVMVPCRNEELVVEGLVTTLLALDYPDDRHEIIIIDDGSDDDTGRDPRRADAPSPDAALHPPAPERRAAGSRVR